VQFALQCRHDDRRATLTPQIVAPLLRRIATSGVASLLDWPIQRWERQFPQVNRSDVNRQLGFLRYARARLEELQAGGGWETEFGCDVWDLRRLGLRPPSTTEGTARLRFDRIPSRGCASSPSAGCEAGSAAGSATPRSPPTCWP
jgi:hypothetical protein